MRRKLGNFRKPYDYLNITHKMASEVLACIKYINDGMVDILKVYQQLSKNSQLNGFNFINLYSIIVIHFVKLFYRQTIYYVDFTFIAQVHSFINYVRKKETFNLSINLSRKVKIIYITIESYVDKQHQHIILEYQERCKVVRRPSS